MSGSRGFSITSTYDQAAYRALAAVSFELFRKHRMQTLAYPALFGSAVLIAVVLASNWSVFNVATRVVLAVFVVVQFAVIPLGAMSARHKMTRQAVKAARKQGEFPATVHFVFRNADIRATINDQVSVSNYSSIDCLVSLGDWRLLFYGRAAYILHASDFSSAEELRDFEEFVSARCELPFNQMKRNGPKRG